MLLAVDSVLERTFTLGTVEIAFRAAYEAILIHDGTDILVSRPEPFSSSLAPHYPEMSYASRNQDIRSGSRSDTFASLPSLCHRFADVCSHLKMWGLAMRRCALMVRMIASSHI